MAGKLPETKNNERKDTVTSIFTVGNFYGHDDILHAGHGSEVASAESKKPK
jgi:hypothetical protein